MKKLRVTVNGKAYEVLVELLEDRPAEAPPASPEPAPSAPTATSGGETVASPLSATVITVDVQVGQAVKQEQNLVTLEAMKMNTFVQATRDGTVAAISVKPGDTVEEGQSLLTIN